MVTKGWVRLVALGLACVFPASLMSAETHGAMLYATNSAILNGIEISKTTAVLPGDKLTVPANSSVTLTLNGTSVLLPKRTSVTFNGDSIALEPNAAVAVNTTGGMAAQVGDIRISPAKNNSARYQVARYNGKVFVLAKQGNVLIASASGSHVLAEGSTTSVPDPAPQKPGAVPATTGAGVGELPTWVAVLVGVAAAGAAAGVAIATTGPPSSPAAP